MKRLALLTILVLVSVAWVSGQAAVKPTAAAATATPAPLPDEKTLSISDATGQGVPTANTAPADISIWDFVKMLVILALVIGMILGFVWFMRKLSGQGTGPESPIKVLHQQSLGASKSLQVIEIGEEILLLGVADSGITVLRELTGTETADAFRLAASQGRARGAKTGFSDLLGNLMGAKPKIRPNPSEPVENSSDFLKKQRERLKKL